MTSRQTNRTPRDFIFVPVVVRRETHTSHQAISGFTGSRHQWRAHLVMPLELDLDLRKCRSNRRWQTVFYTRLERGPRTYEKAAIWGGGKELPPTSPEIDQRLWVGGDFYYLWWGDALYNISMNKWEEFRKENHNLIGEQRSGFSRLLFIYGGDSFGWYIRNKYIMNRRWVNINFHVARRQWHNF